MSPALRQLEKMRRRLTPAFRSEEVKQSCLVEQTDARRFAVPKNSLILDAPTYYKMIDWSTISTTEPPLLAGWSKEDSQKLRGEPLTLPRYPSHTQSLERCIRLVTEAAQSVVGHDSWDGFIKSRVASRELMPKFEFKKDYVAVTF